MFGVPKDRSKDAAAPDMTIMLTGPPGRPELAAAEKAASVGALVHKVVHDTAIEVKNLGKTGKEADWTIRIAKANAVAVLEGLDDIMLLCHYTVEVPKED
jgi:hypothetical protein